MKKDINCSFSSSCNDSELINLAKCGNDAAFNELVTRYSPVLRAKVKDFKGIGLDSDDLFQESLIALLEAVKTYKTKYNTSLKTYIGICVERRLISLYNFFSSKKRIPLSQISYIQDDEFTNTIKCNDLNPEYYIIKREEVNVKKGFIKKVLTELEYSVLFLYISGRTYEEISSKLNVNSKTVDNALQRARKKLKKYVF